MIQLHKPRTRAHPPARYYRLFKPTFILLSLWPIYVSRVSLKNYVEGDGNSCPDEWTLWSFLSDIARGLSHVHAQGYVHMDIKPANIFINDDTHLKIGDFGTAANRGGGGGGGVLLLRSFCATAPLASPGTAFRAPQLC